MSGIWQKLRPHVLSWHMLPCLVMLIAAVGIAIATGRAGGIVGAIGCMVMMMAMMSMLGGHHHGASSDEERKN